MVKITICIGSSCHLKGSRQVVETLQKLINEHNLTDEIELGGTFCLGKCINPGVNLLLDDESYSVKPEEVEQFFKDKVLPKVQK